MAAVTGDCQESAPERGTRQIDARTDKCPVGFRAMQRERRSLRIVCADLDLRKMFLITQLDRELSIETSVEHALW